MQALLGAGLPLSARTAGRQSLLHYAALGGALQVVARLLEAGAAPGDADADGNTPLHCAAERGHLQVCRRMPTRNSQAAAAAVAQVVACQQPLHLLGLRLPAAMSPSSLS